MDYDATFIPPTSPLLFYEQNGITIPPTSAGLQTELSNGIKIYGNGQAVEKITHLVNEYPLI